MTSMPASRNARAMTLAPRSCPSRPGFATSTRIFRSAIDLHLTTEGAEVDSYKGLPTLDCRFEISDGKPHSGQTVLNLQPKIFNLKSLPYMVFISRLRHRYQQATERYGSHTLAIFAITSG